MPEPRGVSQALAMERAGRLCHVTCALTLRLPEDPDAVIDGHLTTSFTLSTTNCPLVIDFAPETGTAVALRVNGRVAHGDIANGHIVIDPGLLLEGPNTVECAFVAGTDGLHRREGLVYSLFVPDRASHVFPCFDQPDLKVRWTVTLEVPCGWRAVSNGREARHVKTGTHEIFAFDPTPPLSTYLLAFVAGRLTVEAAECAGRAFRIFHQETSDVRLARNIGDIAGQHAHALTWLEGWTDEPYGFDSFDIVLIPSFQFSGMEHPGAVYYDADLLLLDASATTQQALSRANVIAHETAHMWFGNLVTMTWFDDVWLKEVLASAMASRIVNPSYPGMDHELRFFVQHYPGAFDVDRTDGANAIRQPLENLNEAGSLYGPIVYLKAPIALRHLELLIGEASLQQAIREYVRTYAFGNASWPDLLAILARHTSWDVNAWSRAWIVEAGRPTLTTEWLNSPTSEPGMTVTQSDPRGRGLVWPQRLQVVLGRGVTTQSIDVGLDVSTVSVLMPVGSGVPDWTLLSGGGLAYGLVSLDAQTIGFLTRSVQTLEDPLTRAAALTSLLDAMLDGQVPPATALDTLLSALAVETDELVLQLLLDQVRHVFWRFIAPDERLDAAARLEHTLRQGLDQAVTTSARSALFTTLRSVALTPPCVEWLEAIWSRTRYIDGLPLSDVDEAGLALDLALRLPERANAIVMTQMSRTSDDDWRARLEFITPAVSPEPAERARFAESLGDPARRRRETWVLAAARCLHHPLRAMDSAPLVRPALVLLRDITRTGDIFFPKRWVDAVLWGHQSPTVADDVRRFIAELPPDYPSRLRLILQAAADPLFRAARLLRK